VNRAVAQRLGERLVHEAVLVEQREPCEARARDDHLEMVAVAGPIHDVELVRVRERTTQQKLEVLKRWEAEARERFLEGYTTEVDPAVLPAGASSMQNLLTIFELERAIYELRYELNNRPEWVPIPVTCITRLLEQAPA